MKNREQQADAVKKKRRIRPMTLLLVVALIVGLGLVSYPTVSNWWNSFHQTRAVAGYMETVANMDQEDFDRMFAEADAYNERLLYNPGRYTPSDAEMAEYNSILDVTGTGIMGYVDIPQIRVKLPIYHGVDEAILQVAIGHIVGTSFPVGGLGTHSAISGHRGLPSARLFTDIDQLREGDRFVVQVLDRTLTYEIDQIHIVLPTELQDLEIDPDQDYCTLITCTPYGINTHRLLIRGHRVSNESDARVTAEAILFDPIIIAPLVAAPIILILVIVLLIATRPRRKIAAAKKNAGKSKNRKIGVRKNKS